MASFPGQTDRLILSHDGGAYQKCPTLVCVGSVRPCDCVNNTLESALRFQVGCSVPCATLNVVTFPDLERPGNADGLGGELVDRLQTACAHPQKLADADANRLLVRQELLIVEDEHIL